MGESKHEIMHRVRKKIKKLSQDFVLNTNSLPFFEKIYLLTYKFALRYAINSLSQIKELKAIYLEETIDSSVYTFGSSDIDLVIVTSGHSSSEKKVLEKLDRIRKAFSIINFTLYSEKQFKNDYTLNPSRIIKRKAPKLLKGENILKGLPVFKDKELIARNFLGACFFEFYMLGDRFFLKKPGLSCGRTFLNVFAKLIRNFCYARELLEFKRPYTRQEICQIAVTAAGAEFIPHEVRQYMLNKQYRDFAVPNGEESYAQVYSKAVLYLDKISGEWLKKKEPINGDATGSLRITSEFLTQETIDAARIEAKSFLEAIPSEFLTYFTTIVLTSIPNTNYFYSVYMILKDDTTEDNLFTFLNWLHRNFKTYFRTVKGSFFLPIFPLIMTKSSFCCLDGYGITNIKLPLEYFFLTRHAEVIYGTEIKNIIKQPSEDILYKNMLSYAAELTKKEMFKIDLERKNYKPRARHLVDFICGILPSIVLFLDKKIIVTTPKEALIEYSRNYKNTESLNKFYNQYNGLPIAELIGKTDEIAKDGTFIIRKQINDIDDILDRIYGRSE